jgi:hypothetical protein
MEIRGEIPGDDAANTAQTGIWLEWLQKQSNSTAT